MIKTILSRPLAVVTVFSVIIIVSVLLSIDIPLNFYPEVDAPVLYVLVPYPGASPEEVEEEIVRPLEGELSGLEGMEMLKSVSSEGMARILMEFDLNADMDATLGEIRSRLGRITPFLPDDAMEPILNRFDPSSVPVIVLTLKGDRSERELMELAKNRAVPSLEGLKGVAAVELSGGRETIVKISLDQLSLESYNLPASRIAQVLSGQNYQLGSGSFTEERQEILIRTNARYSSLKEIEDTVVLLIPDYRGGTGIPVRLKDLAKVEWGYADREETVLIDNEVGIILNVRKSSGANSIDVAARVEEEMDKISASLPAGTELSVLLNPTVLVVANLASVGGAVGYGILFAVLVLIIFLRQFRTTLIVAISIPISLIMTAAVLAATNHTINIVTIIGLAMGVGLIVDSSIIIIENIYRYRMKGLPLKTSAVRGAGEMMTPIIASTLTTAAVFFPLIIYSNELGFLGRFFSELAFTIITAITSSLLVAAFLVPVLSAHFMTIHTREERPVKSPFLRKIDNAVEEGITALEGSFGRFLTRCLRNKKLTILAIALILGSSLFLSPLLEIKMMPELPETSIRIIADFPVGSSREHSRNVIRDLNNRIQREINGADRIIMKSAKAKGSLEITLEDHINKTVEIPLIAERMRSFFPDYPDVNFHFENTMEGSDMLSSSGVDVSVTGANWDAVLRRAEEIERLMRGVKGLEEVRNDSMRGLPQAEIVPNRQALYEQNLSAYMIATEVRILTAGYEATQFSRGGKSYDVVLRLQESDRSTEEDLERLFLVNPRGETVTLSQIAGIRRTTGPVDIIRENQVRTVHVKGKLTGKAKMDRVTREVTRLLEADLEPMEGVEWTVGGELDDFQESGRTMLLVMGIAALLVIAVMVAQFESFIDPIIIALALPMMFLGVLLIFFLTGTPLSMISLMGVIMLLGIVVNNGIVLVDQTKLLRKRGMALDEACVESGRTRLRPVLMTTLTTVLAMIPLAFFPGDGGELMQPMGVAVVGGLTSSTLGTLVLVPTLYALFHRGEE